MELVIRYRSGKKNVGADAQSCSPVDCDDNGDSSLAEKRDGDNDIFVATTVIQHNAKSGERDNEGSNETESGSSCCQQEQGVSSDNVNIRNRQQKDPELKLIMDYLENGDLPNDERKARVSMGKIIVSSCE